MVSTDVWKSSSKPGQNCKPSLRWWLFCVCLGFPVVFFFLHGLVQTSCLHTAPVTLNGVCGKQILVRLLRSTSIKTLACFSAADSQTLVLMKGMVLGSTSPDSALSLTVLKSCRLGSVLTCMKQKQLDFVWFWQIKYLILNQAVLW